VAVPALAGLASALAGPLSPAVASTHAEKRVLVLDAAITKVQSSGPTGDRGGRRQIATGVLRSASGVRSGRFSFTCVWTSVKADAAREWCAGTAWTHDGRLVAAGPSQSNAVTHRWKIEGGTGGYRGARGDVLVRDLSDRESLLTVTVITWARRLHADVVARLSVNDGFITRADALCGTAAKRLGALPSFPVDGFDPLHPQPAQLAQVGAFFTGPGDPRPILRTLDEALEGLGRPRASRGAWSAVLHARRAALAVINAQDRAALAGDVPGFVASVHASSASFRAIAITANVFGVDHCVP
jgi:hypothetical protein